ncbi:hypothetical protein M432DRAFT_411600 [Thermoascus aurantiacus ATCC 26904]
MCAGRRKLFLEAQRMTRGSHIPRLYIFLYIFLFSCAPSLRLSFCPLRVLRLSLSARCRPDRTPEPALGRPRLARWRVEQAHEPSTIKTNFLSRRPGYGVLRRGRRHRLRVLFFSRTPGRKEHHLQRHGAFARIMLGEAFPRHRWLPAVSIYGVVQPCSAHRRSASPLLRSCYIPIPTMSLQPTLQGLWHMIHPARLQGP